jgi:ABC-type protease/lipase transport system fused ATPase/permease subunit
MLVLVEGEAKLFGPRNEVLATLQGQAAQQAPQQAARKAAPAPTALRA